MYLTGDGAPNPISPLSGKTVMIFWLVPSKMLLNPRGQPLFVLGTRETKSHKGWHGAPVLVELIVGQDQRITSESIHPWQGF